MSSRIGEGSDIVALVSVVHVNYHDSYGRAIGNLRRSLGRHTLGGQILFLVVPLKPWLVCLGVLGCQRGGFYR